MAADGIPFVRTEVATFDEPWAMAFQPGTGRLFVTEKAGTIKFVKADGSLGSVSGVPKVDYGGQGGLGDIAFAPDFATSGMVYLSWAEAGEGKTRGAVVGRAELNCDDADSCALNGMQVIWRQAPKVTGQGHYSHRIAFSPDGQYLFIASGDRQKGEPAQNTSNTLGSVVRLMPDGTPAPGNPLAAQANASDQIWSYGHRNILGLRFEPAGRLWALEHGPKGGDELNNVVEGANYGWPVVSDGVNYDGSNIPDHDTRPQFKQAAIGWTPVIAPGDMIFYTGAPFAAWNGDALITGLKTKALIHVAMDGTSAREVARYSFDDRLRAIAQGPDGAIWVAEDKKNAKLYKLTPKT